MDTSTGQLAALIGRESIRDCIARLARGEDRRDAELIRESFWPDAKVDFGIFAGSFDEYLAWVMPGSPAVPVTQHVLGHTVIDWSSGDTALAETHVTAYHRLAAHGEDRDSVLGGRYLDQLDKRGGRWRIGHRTMLYDWYQDLGRSADWSRGLMGLPFRADYSERHFGGGSK
jgi:hypothetical protein